MASIAEILQTGWELHRAGNFPQAEQLYRQALQADPNHAGATDLLGVVMLQTGRPQAAVELLKSAILLDPLQAVFHIHLADAYRSLARLDEAAACYRKAAGLAPASAEVHDSLGSVLKAQGDLAGAASSYRNALRARPGFAQARYNLGVVLNALGEREEARNCYRLALVADPALAEAHMNLAHLSHGDGNIAAAAASYQEALRLRPDYRDALTNYGRLLQGQGRLDDALVCFERVVELNPGSAGAHFDRANVFKLKDRRREAVAGYRETLRLDPNFAAAYHNLSVALNEVQQPDAALDACRKGLACDPNSALLCSDMAFALHTQGRAEEAISWFRKAVALDPTRSVEYGNLLYTLNYVPDVDPAALFAEHRAWAARHAEPLTAQTAPHPNDRTPQRRLRVGYVSAHFCVHAVNYFTEPMIAAHDHEEFEIYCYSDVRAPDAATARLKAAADQWRDVACKTDAELAQLVRDDRIDLLVDLAGHIGGNRLLVFARKPAPIQITYIGYQNTTGMSAMDYRLTDERADPSGLTDSFYTEKLVRLPRSFFCYRPADDAPPITPLPAWSAGHVTFGSFNAFRKVTPQVIRAWLQVFARVAGSRLIVLASRGGYVEQYLHETARAQGIDPARIELFDRRATRAYLQLIAQADIALDPFPFTGHTTTCDSIWMGVPVVMLEGATYVSRFGGSALANVGLERWIARSVEEYVDRAVELAADVEALAHLRAELRPRMAASPLLDHRGFTRHVEDAYREMWREWAGQGPTG